MTQFVFGIDEAGRGPLAGPIAVGACKADQDNPAMLARFFHDFPFGKDSKKMTEEERNFWFERMNVAQAEKSLAFAVAFASAKEIDADGLTKVSRRLIESLLRRLKARPQQSCILLDGGLKAPQRFKNQETIIKGDEQVFLISLASIAAKVLRDRHMVELSQHYALYGFDRHKGYATREHFEALDKFGISPVHRKRFLVKWGLRQFAGGKG